MDKLSSALYLLAACLLVFSGILFASLSVVSAGVLFLYLYISDAAGQKESSKCSGNCRLVINLVFLSVSVWLLFTVIKLILFMVLKDIPLTGNPWTSAAAAAAGLLLEISRRIIPGRKKTVSVFICLVLFVMIAGSQIIGGFWQNLVPVTGLILLVIMTSVCFRNAYRELLSLLQSRS